MTDIRNLAPNFTMGEMPKEAALEILREADLLSQTIGDAAQIRSDRMHAAHALRGSLVHGDPEVNEAGLNIMRWLVSPELNKGVIEASGELPDNTQVTIEDNLVTVSFDPAAHVSVPITDSQVVKDVVAELARGVRNPNMQSASGALDILSVLAIDSTYKPEARQGLGRGGRYTPHAEVAGLALDSLYGIIQRDIAQPDFFDDLEDPAGNIGSTLIAINAIGKRPEPEFLERAEAIFQKFVMAHFSNPRMLKLVEYALVSELTEFSLSFRPSY